MARLKDVADFYIALAQEMAELGLGDAMTNLRLQKMLYYAQGWSLARNGKALFDESIEAWPYGPVVPECYNWYKGFGSNALSAELPKRDVFSAEEYELLLDIWTELSPYSTAQLVTMSHEKDGPWDHAWNKGKSREILAEEMTDYFSTKVLTTTKEQLASIPAEKPLYRQNGIPVFASEGAWVHE